MRVAVFIAAAVLLLCVAGVAVEAGTRTVEQNGLPHPESVATPETLALWAKVRKEMEARNNTRPTRQQLYDLGYISKEEMLQAPMDGAFGVDVSSWLGQSTWSCVKDKGYSFAIVREFMETCQVDPNGVHTVANAWAAGIAHVDVYLFPSYGCGVSAAGQVDAVIDTMGGIPFGQIWLDIEDGGQGSAANNYNWMMQALQHGEARLGPGKMGIYSSRYEWSQVMPGYNGPTQYPLWYANYDGVPSFANFPAFAGWSRPAMKQFAGDASLCGADVDLNWYA